MFKNPSYILLFDEIRYLSHVIQLILKTRRKEYKEKIIQKIEEGRRMMGLDMIVRTASGEPATEKNTGIVTLLHMVRLLFTLLSILSTKNSLQRTK